MARLSSQRGFTLVELLVVMLVLAILGAVAYASFTSSQDRASDTQAQQNLFVAEKSAASEYIFQRSLPPEADLILEVSESEPKLNVHAYNDGANPSDGPADVSLTRDSDEQITVCSRSESGRFYCLRSHQEAALVLASATSPEDQPLYASLDPTGLLFPDTAHAAAITDGRTSRCMGAVEADARECLADADDPAHEVGAAVPGWGGSTPELPPSPANLAPPEISGQTEVGQTLTGSDGSWSGEPSSFAYEWQRCDASGNNCSDIAGATSSNYVLTPADLGATMRIWVTATNDGGSTQVSSNPSNVVTAPPPVNTALPTISGSTQVGQTLSGTDGSWANSPTSYSRQWRRCDASGNSCANIAGATGSTYALVAADVGSTIRFRVTASNAHGSTSADSNQSAVVTNPSYAQVVASDNPWAYYRLDESSGTVVTDSSGNGRNLTYNGGITKQVNGATSDNNKAVSFGNANAQLISGQPGALSGSYTVESWVKPNCNGIDGIFGTRMPDATGLQVSLYATQLKVDIPDANQYGWKVQGAADTSFRCTAGTWYHIAVAVTNSTWRIFVNGVSTANGSFGSSPASALTSVSPNRPFMIGDTSGNGTWEEFSGTIDEVAIYNSALSAARIQAHYNAR